MSESVMKTDMEQVRNKALILLENFPIKIIDPDTKRVDHPFTEYNYFSEIDKETQEPKTFSLDGEEERNKFINIMRGYIAESETPDEIFSMMSKRYQTFFLQSIVPYLTAQDIGTCLSDIWVLANTGLLRKTDLIKLFKQSDPETLMSDSERAKLAGFPETV